MNAELAAMPDDIDSLKAALLVARAEAAAAAARCSSDQALIGHLKLEIAELNRDRFGPRSERTARLLGQMEFQLEELDRLSGLARPRACQYCPATRQPTRKIATLELAAD